MTRLTYQFPSVQLGTASLTEHVTNRASHLAVYLQERKSFHIRYHPDATQNEQKWEYLDAETLWDIPKIKTAVKRSLLTTLQFVSLVCLANFAMKS